MTRFARASGSKASNERLPEESTPWSVMKQQVVQGKQNLEQVYDTNWKSVLDTEKKIEENKKSVWCEFEVDKPKVEDNKRGKSKKLKEDSLGIKCKSAGTDVSSTTGESVVEKNKNLKEQSEDEKLILSNSISDSFSDRKFNKSKAKISKIKPSYDVDEFSELEPLNSEKQSKSSIKVNTFSDSIINIDDNKSKISSNHQENNILNKKKSIDSSDKYNISISENLNTKYNETNENKKINDSFINESYKTDVVNGSNIRMKRNNSVTWQKHNKEERSSQPYKRRKYDEGDMKLEINGQEIWVTRLDGFYIMKEDAERIRQLEKDLLSRGVSKQEVRAVIKKERRNAEKSLARKKKKVCYHCRKGGHTLSSCPKLNDNGAQTVGNGICYKCGSTEHTHFQCKVNSGQSYKFATCFICKQEGHISRQCPDNPRGIYPTGGGCRLCGDVTHFKRECPTLQEKKNKITVSLIDQDIETLGDHAGRPVSKDSNNKKQNKIVKFS